MSHLSRDKLNKVSMSQGAFYALWGLVLLGMMQLILGYAGKPAESDATALKQAAFKSSESKSSRTGQLLSAQLQTLQATPLFYPQEPPRKKAPPQKSPPRQSAFTEKLKGVLGDTAYFISGKEVRVGERIGAARLVSLDGPVAEFALGDKIIRQSVLDHLDQISSSKSKPKSSSKSSKSSQSEDKASDDIVALLTSHSWLREGSNGTEVRFTFRSDGSCDTAGRSSWRSWELRGGKVVFQGGSRGSYTFSKDKNSFSGVSPYNRVRYTFKKQ